MTSITKEIYRRAKDYIKKIDEMGGSVSAIEKGFIQREIQDSAYKYQREIEKDKRIVVGLNRFQVEEGRPTNLLRVNPAVREAQAEKLKRLREERDSEGVEQALERLKRTAEGSGNLMPSVFDSVKAYATLGEICDVLRGVFGEYQQINTLG